MGRPRKRTKTDAECRAVVEATLARAQGRIEALRSLLDMVGGEPEDDEDELIQLIPAHGLLHAPEIKPWAATVKTQRQARAGSFQSPKFGSVIPATIMTRGRVNLPQC